MYQRIIFNVVGGIRRDILEGRRHIVAPVSMLAEGVINGSAGPIFYPADEISKSASLWNHKPVVVYHPDKDGVPISAADPVVLNTRGVGRVLAAGYSDGKLRAECWLDEDRLNSIDRRILNDLEAGKPVEVSTGLTLDLDETKGEWNKSEYRGVARNHRPDHLAALPDKVGAYSIKMGGGMLTVNSGREPEGIQQVTARSIGEALKRIGVIQADNAMSVSDTTRQICDLLADKYGEKGKYWDGYVCDTYLEGKSGYVVFRSGGYGSPEKLLNYTVKDGVVSLADEATEVVRKTEYVAANGALVVDGTGTAVWTPKTQENSNMAFDQKAHVDNLIANGGGVWTEADRPFLMNMPPDKAEKVRVANSAPPPPPPPANPIPAAPAIPATPAGAPVTPPPLPQVQPQAANNSAATLEQYVANAPPHIRARLQDSLTVTNAEQERMITDILAYPLNQWEEGQLRASPISELRKVHNMIPKQASASETMASLLGGVANYQGAAGGFVNNLTAPPQDFLPLPQMDFVPGQK